MLEKIKKISQIEITETGNIQVRESLRIIEDGNVLSETYHRYVLEPNSDLTGQPDLVIELANVVWSKLK